MPPPEIGPSQLGERLVVRCLTGGVGPSGGPEMTDVIGHLRAVGEEFLTLERRDETLVDVRRADIVTWKLVPPARP